MRKILFTFAFIVLCVVVLHPRQHHDESVECCVVDNEGAWKHWQDAPENPVADDIDLAIEDTHRNAPLPSNPAAVPGYGQALRSEDTSAMCTQQHGTIEWVGNRYVECHKGNVAGVTVQTP